MSLRDTLIQNILDSLKPAVSNAVDSALLGRSSAPASLPSPTAEKRAAPKSVRKAKAAGPRSATVGSLRGRYLANWISGIDGSLKTIADAKAKYPADATFVEGQPAPAPKSAIAPAANEEVEEAQSMISRGHERAMPTAARVVKAQGPIHRRKKAQK